MMKELDESQPGQVVKLWAQVVLPRVFSHGSSGAGEAHRARRWGSRSRGGFRVVTYGSTQAPAPQAGGRSRKRVAVSGRVSVGQRASVSRVEERCRPAVPSTEGLCGKLPAEGVHAPGDTEDRRGPVADGGAGEWECEVVEGCPAEAVLVAQLGWEDVRGREPVGGRE